MKSPTRACARCAANDRDAQPFAEWLAKTRNRSRGQGPIRTYPTEQGAVLAVNHVSFNIYQGELLGLIGESGCGKTTTAMAILRLLQPPGEITGGEIILNGKTDLVPLSAAPLRQIRWHDVALVPQGAMNSLNPVMRSRSNRGQHPRARTAAHD